MKKLFTLIICAFLSVLLHFYLSQRSYSLSADQAKKSSICHIHSALNCDRALSSPYSELAGLPLSNYGLALNLIIVLLGFLLMTQGRAGLIQPALSFFVMLSAGASLIMLAFSFFILHFFCLLCSVLYVLSFVMLFCTFFLSSSVASLKKLLDFSPQKGRGKLWYFLSSPKGWVCGAGVLLVSLSFLIHLIFIQVYDIPSIKKMVRFQVMDWLSAPAKSPVEGPLLTSGPHRQQALMTVTEFADFLCYHCRNMHYSFKALSLPQIRREFFSFPLDQCQGSSLSCLLTRAVYCAEKQEKGWAFYDLIFEHQPLFNSLRNQQEKAIKKLKQLSQHLIDQALWQECINSAPAFLSEAEQIQAGQKRGIKGTPSLFVNDKKVSHRYLTKTLKAIQKRLVSLRETQSVSPESGR